LSTVFYREEPIQPPWSIAPGIVSHLNLSQIIFGFKIKADSGFKPQAYDRIRKDLKPESNTDIGQIGHLWMGAIYAFFPESAVVAIFQQKL
jgi:hypothetical protein